MAKVAPVVEPEGDETVDVPQWADRRTLLGLLWGLAGLALIALVASLRDPISTIDGAGNAAVHFGWMSLVPAIVAIALAFTTRNVLLSLFLGVVSGAVVYAFGSGVTLGTTFPWSRLNLADTFLIPALGTPGYAVIILVYLWGLGGLIGLWTRTGGALRFAEWAAGKVVHGPRSAMVFGWFLGLVFHQGGTISTVLAGTTLRPLFDKYNVSKEEGSYIVDSTASPIATLIPFNAFPFVVAASVIGTIPFFTEPTEAQSMAKAVAFFFESIPYNFYAIFAVLSTLLFALRVFPPIFGMKKARHRVETTGELVRPGSEPLAARELQHVEVHPGYATGIGDFLVPLMFLITISVGPFFIQKFIFGNDQPTIHVTLAFISALLVAIIMAVSKGMPLRVALDGVIRGAKGVTLAAMIIGFAFTLKVVADNLGTGLFVADLLKDLDAGLLPFLLLVAGMVVAFSTGTSFGTFAVLFPVAMPLADRLLPGNELFLSVCFGAVISGSVFGDQASPISDTTVLSSLAVGCDLMDHVTTQIPYAAIAAGLGGILYLVLGAIAF